MPKPLTSLEKRILDYLVDYLRKNTYQPSIREIGDRFSIKSTKTVSEYLQSLADKGWVERDPSRSRGVRLIGLDMNPATVRVASIPNTAKAEFEIDRKFAGSSGAFCVTMDGDYLVADGIRNGDMLLVEPVDGVQLEHGDFVCLRDDPNRIRRVHCNGEEQFLDDAESVVRCDETLRARVAGRGISVVRRLRTPLRVQESATVA